jgi:hypothetical protein
MSLTKLSLAGNEFGYSDIPAGDGKIGNLFFTVHIIVSGSARIYQTVAWVIAVAQYIWLLAAI